MATRWYVSNSALNGYSLGVDTNNGLSVSTPFLTINHAISASSAGDTITINPTSNSLSAANNPYNETTQVSVAGKTLNIGGDTTYVTYENTPLVVVVQSTGSTDVFLSGSSAVLVINDIIIDPQNVGSKRAWKGLAETSITWTRVSVVNCSIFCFSSFTSGNFIIDRFFTDPSCLFNSANGIFNFGSMTTGNVTVKGGNWASPYQTAGSHFPLIFIGGTLTSFTITTDINGIRPQVSGDTEFLSLSTAGTVTGTLLFDSVDLNNAFSAIQMLSTTSGSIGLLNVTNCTLTRGNLTHNAGGGGFIENITELVTIGTISGNVLGADPVNALGYVALDLHNGSGSPKIFNNTITYNSQSHTFQLGSDGFIIDESNTATTTGGQNLGDTTLHTYVDQFVTSSAQTSSNHSSYFAELVVTLKTIGSPTGNITAYLYSDNAGIPGALLATSTTTLTMSSITSANLQYAFEFPVVKLTPSTKYHYVFQSSTVDPSNYVVMAWNTTTTIGSIYTAAVIGTWTANTSNALLIFINTGCYGIVDARVYNNTFISTYDDTVSITHMCAMAGQTRGWAYSNLVIGGSLGIMFKENKGGTATNPALGFDNLVYQPFGGISGVGGLLAKASSFVNFYNNTVVYGTGSLGSVVSITCDANAFGYVPVNALQSTNITVQNNILVQNGSTNAMYGLRANLAGTLPTSLTITNNDVWLPNGGNFGLLEDINGNVTTTYATWAAWQGAGYDANSVNLDPLLKNEINPAIATDFVPANSSPAKGIGITTNGLVNVDYFGNPFFAIPDAGAVSISYNNIKGTGSNNISPFWAPTL